MQNIPEIKILDLTPDGDRLVLLREDDHLLRRFGQLEVHTYPAGSQTPFKLRPVADQVWALLSGETQMLLVDRRAGSPSENQVVRLNLAEEKSQAVLVPFGVAVAFTVRQDSRLLCLSTHAEGTHAEDETLSRAALADLIA